MFKENQPIIIGLAGKAGSGKTSVAEEIVPKGGIEASKYGMYWDHIFFALPLYELASIRRNTKGFNEESRKLYSIHNVLFEIFGGSTLGNMPHYYELVSMVDKINRLPIESEGVKPRSFLQQAGDICRDYNKDCFAQWGIIKSVSLYKKYVISREKEDQDSIINPMGIIISDVRFVNEAEAILRQPNGVLICYDASQETLNDRILKRDGKLMSDEQKSHKSEQEIEMIKNMASFVINTDNMSVEEQTLATVSKLGLLQDQNA